MAQHIQAVFNVTDPWISKVQQWISIICVSRVLCVVDLVHCARSHLFLLLLAGRAGRCCPSGQTGGEADQADGQAGQILGPPHRGALQT